MAPEVKDSTLTAAQAKSALLTLDDMPTGWTQQKPEPDDDEEPTVTPMRCSAVLDAVDQQGKPLAEAEAVFSPSDLPRAGSDSQLLATLPASDPEEVDRCVPAVPEVHQHFKGGSSATFEATGLSFPNLGDRTLALRLKAKSDGINLVLDVVYIAKGNNGVALLVTGLQPLDGAVLEGFAKKAVARLDAVSR